MLWFDRAGLDADLYDSLKEAVGVRRPRVLAWASLADGVVVGLPDRLAVRRGDAWQLVGWDEILTGGWDPVTNRLEWSTGRRTDHVELSEPGRLPELFQERVQASIVITHHGEISGGRTVAVSARRNPGDPRSALRWIVSPGDGVRPEDPADEAEITAVVAEAKAEWDIA